MKHLEGMLDKDGWRLHHPNYDGTWRASTPSTYSQKWVPRGYNLSDPATLGCLIALLGESDIEMKRVGGEWSVSVNGGEPIMGESLGILLASLCR